MSGNNIINNSLLKIYSKNKDAKIKVNLDPLANTDKIEKLESSIDGIIIHTFLNLAFLFIASSMIVIIIKERENNAKH